MSIALTNNPTKISEQLTENEAIAIKAFSKLLKLRRDWIGDWDPDWTNVKYCIEVYRNEINVDFFPNIQKLFHFQQKKWQKNF